MYATSSNLKIVNRVDDINRRYADYMKSQYNLVNNVKDNNIVGFGFWSDFGNSVWKGVRTVSPFITPLLPYGGIIQKGIDVAGAVTGTGKAKAKRGRKSKKGGAVVGGAIVGGAVVGGAIAGGAVAGSHMGGKKRGRKAGAKMAGAKMAGAKMGAKVYIPSNLKGGYNTDAGTVGSPVGAGKSKSKSKSKKTSSWLEHVKQYSKAHNMSYKDAMKASKASYKK